MDGSDRLVDDGALGFLEQLFDGIAQLFLDRLASGTLLGAFKQLVSCQRRCYLQPSVQTFHFEYLDDHQLDYRRYPEPHGPDGIFHL